MRRGLFGIGLAASERGSKRFKQKERAAVQATDNFEWLSTQPPDTTRQLHCNVLGCEG
jgi:hypothetical protein